MKTRVISLLAIAALAVGGWAETLTEAQIRAAATQFVTADDVGSRALGGRTVKSVEPRDALWVARLSPSGYVVLSGNTDATPVLAFSDRDFVSPPDSTPFGALLAVANTNALKSSVLQVVRSMNPLGSTSAASVSLTRERTVAEIRAAKWAQLLADATETSEDSGLVAIRAAEKRGATGGDETSSRDIKNLLNQNGWDQCQPYNDFAPVISTEKIESDYRQRNPCGCVATAYAQVLNYWKWPQRLDTVISCDHVLQRESGVSTFKIRFDGNTPFVWDKMQDEYPYRVPSTGNYDLRSDNYPESTRFPIAHLILASDVMSRMYFAEGTSGRVGSAHVYMSAQLNSWYETGEYVSRDENTDASIFYENIRQSLLEGAPVLVGVYGHQIVADGWMGAGTNDYEFVHLNYGWGGYNDGFFSIGETVANVTMNGYLDSALFGFAPRFAAQPEPLPGVSTNASELALEWSVPEKIVEKIDGKGFRICCRVFDETSELKTWEEDFSTSIPSNYTSEAIYVGTAFDGESTNAGLIIPSKPCGGTAEVMRECLLTEDSVLTYSTEAYAAAGVEVRLQASFNGRAWEDIDEAVPIGDGESAVAKTTRTIAVGKGRGGQLMRLRVAAVVNVLVDRWSSDKRICGVQLDDFKLTNIREGSESAANYTMSECATAVANVFRTADVYVGPSGSICSYSVTPIDEDSADCAYVWTRIDTARADSAAAARPEIKEVTSVTESSAQVQEGFYRECARGKNYFFVNCSTNVVSLEARPSHLTLLPDDKVAVEKVGDGKFAVTVDGSGIDDSFDRSRLVLTLAATDADGGTAYKDLSLRFSSETSAESAVAPWKCTTVTDDAPIAVPFDWLVEKGIVSSADATDVAKMNDAAKLDSDNDGMANYAEYLCGTDPTNATDKLTVSIRMVDDAPQISWSPTNTLAKYVVIGVTNLTEKTWTETNDVNYAGMRFFRVRVEPK